MTTDGISLCPVADLIVIVETSHSEIVSRDPISRPDFHMSLFSVAVDALSSGLIVSPQIDAVSVPRAFTRRFS